MRGRMPVGPVGFGEASVRSDAVETMPKRSRCLLEEALQKLVLLVVVQVWLVDHLRRDLAAPTAIVSKIH